MAAEIDLTTLAEMKAMLEIASATQDDPIIAMFISGVSQTVIDYLGQQFEVRERVERLDIHRGQLGFALSAAPVHQLSEVKNDAGRTFGSESIINADNYDWETKRRFGIFYVDHGGLHWGKGSLQVTYVGGFGFDRDVYIARQDDPPGAPNTNDTYLVGAVPTGAWIGQANRLATWNGAAWLFKTAYQQAQDTYPAIKKAVMQQVSYEYRTKDFQGTQQIINKQSSLMVRSIGLIRPVEASLRRYVRQVTED